MVALTAALLLLVMVRSTDWSPGPAKTTSLLITAAFAAWNLAPLAGMSGVVVIVVRTWPRGLPAVALGVVASCALTLVLLQDYRSSESSTAALLFVFLPMLRLAVAEFLDRTRGRWSASVFDAQR